MPSQASQASQAASSSPGVKRKQPSISSFFTKKAGATSQSAGASGLISSRGPKGVADSLAGISEEKENSKDGASDRWQPQPQQHQQHQETESIAIGPECHSTNDNRNSNSNSNGNVYDDDDDEDVVLRPAKRAKTNGSCRSPEQQQQQQSDRGASGCHRTDRFKFASTDSSTLNTQNAEQVLEDRERLHRRFVKKLGGPDCLIGLGRKQIDRDVVGTDGLAQEDATTGDGEEDGEQEAAALPQIGAKGRGAKRGGGKLTPLEKQVIDIKRKHMDTILVVEVGYKFRFFGEDARVAAKELSIVCIPGKLRYDEHPSEAHLDRFASASIPVHRLHVHVKRLITAGHKVGIVRQLETAALKAAGDNRNAPFVRKLTHMYTKGTYIDDAEGLEGTASPSLSATSPATGYLLCITETTAKGSSNDEKVLVGIVAVQPATGDIIYDDFEDGFMRSEIETRLLHIAPCELLLVGELSKATEKLIQHLSGNKTNVFGDKVRVERTPKQKTAVAEAHSHVSSFYAGHMEATSPAADLQASDLLRKVLDLPEQVTICLSAMITHLKDYGLEHVFWLTKYFQPFSARSHMLLNGNTLASLEIYQNQTDHSSNGSLFWTLDRTQTRFGQRLLRKWVGRPLLDRARLEERINAVEELKSPERSADVDRIKGLLGRVKSDLEKNLIRIYYGKCTRPELLVVLQTLQMISTEFSDIKCPEDSVFRSPLLSEAVARLPTILEDVVFFLEKINMHAAKRDDKYEFFRESEETDEITEHKLGIAGIEHELQEHRDVVAEKLGRKRVEYSTCAGIEYLIELENSSAAMKRVPASWVKISGTRKLSRFHTPEVIQLLRQRDQHKEALAAACDKAFATLLAEVSGRYQKLRDSIQSLATLDCLLSLAKVASRPGYVKPEYTTETCIHVEQGRHPMVEQLLLDSYVANDIHLESDRTRALLVTGPNMGGKSSYVRQVALIAIMGQIGSYVPAQSAKLGMLDAVFTRMGAFDNMLAGESTFMVELSETADILKQATSRSLVILDELGRGTSTHDGVAIAQAVLEHVVRSVRCLTLFITHYQHLSTLAQAFPHHELRNVHMRFTESRASSDGQVDITFLYEVGDGVAHRSYGLNVARLANLPPSIIDVARQKSAELEADIHRRRLAHMADSLRSLVADDDRLSIASDGEVLLDRLLANAEQLARTVVSPELSNDT